MTRLSAAAFNYILTLVTRACAFALLLLISAHGVIAQSITHPNAAPGSPTGSYALSGFESINLYNGGLNFHLPLLQVGGRGAAGYTMRLPIETRWRVLKNIMETLPSLYEAFYTALPSSWYYGDKPGYGPGKLLARGVKWLPDGCNDVFFPHAWTVTRLTFVTPDGTEYEFARSAL